jgi:hypothetical protein
MSTGVIAAIIVVAIIVVAGVAAGMLGAARRRRRLQQRFGPEYDRAVGEQQSQRKAEAELAGRERRVQSLNIRPLDAASQAEYASRWALTQEQFVDRPQEAVAQAQLLVTAVMNERGYPTENYDQIMADLSVQHANTLEHYRAAQAISEIAAAGSASTEDLRQAMIQYRALFSDLLGEPSAQQPDAPRQPAGLTGEQPWTAGQQPEMTGQQPEMTGRPAQMTGPAVPGPRVQPESPRAGVAAGEAQAAGLSDQSARRTRRS